MKSFLHVGCGQKKKERTTPGFSTDDWMELRLDINPAVQPDILGSMTAMEAVDTASVDAVYSSHNLEHLYLHEVPLALAEFRRVLRADGFAVITCPDLQSVCALVADDRLTDPAYMSPAGPVAPIDILYGHRPSIVAGNLYMAHRCGFTAKLLTAMLHTAGFSTIILRKRPQFYDLWVVATLNMMSDESLRALALRHFPG